jgi:hypothetical protein
VVNTNLPSCTHGSARYCFNVAQSTNTPMVCFYTTVPQRGRVTRWSSQRRGEQAGRSSGLTHCRAGALTLILGCTTPMSYLGCQLS